MDDTMMASERDTILAVINASVLLPYFLYGFPGGDRWGGGEDKYEYEPFAHYHQEHLGLDINARTMMVLWPV
jgi:hypothetical protein